MSKKDDGGPAFPVPIVATKHESGKGYEELVLVPNKGRGMSLRDWFAGQALTAIMGDDWYRDGGPEADNAWSEAAEGVARDAYTIADAMLTERAKS